MDTKRNDDARQGEQHEPMNDLPEQPADAEEAREVKGGFNPQPEPPREFLQQRPNLRGRR